MAHNEMYILHNMTFCWQKWWSSVELHAKQS